MVNEEGETVTVGVPTVSPVLPTIEPTVALIVVPPFATAVARPCLPDALLIVATAVLVELQTAVVVRFCWLPSL
jgi:hypothetical protein